MSGSFVAVMFDFRWIALSVLAVGFALYAAGGVLAGNLDWNKSSVAFFGLFFGLGDRHLFWLSAGLMRVVFVGAMLIFRVQIKPSHTVLYLLLFLLCGLLRGNFTRLLFDLVNSAVIYASLLVANIFSGFYSQINGDWRVMSVYVLMALFVILYTLYSYLKELAGLLKERVE